MSSSKEAKKPWYQPPWRSNKRKKGKNQQPHPTKADKTTASSGSSSDKLSPEIVKTAPETVPLPVTEHHSTAAAPPASHEQPNPTSPETHPSECTPPGSLDVQASKPPNDADASPDPMLNATAMQRPKSTSSVIRNVVTMVVMGPTGVGKTTFINSFKSSFSLSKDGYHELDAGTRDIEVTTIDLEQTGVRLILVDTPGFDDPDRPNSEVLGCISKYLEDIYRSQKPLDGIIYLHRITDIRFDAGASDALNIFKKLYGSEGYDKLGLITTMWNDIRPDMKYKYEVKEKELKSTTWAPFFLRKEGNNAFIDRFDATDDDTTKTTALNIVTSLITNSLPTPLKLRLQVELVDEAKKLPRTEAGRAAFTLAETARYYLKELAS